MNRGSVQLIHDQRRKNTQQSQNLEEAECNTQTQQLVDVCIPNTKRDSFTYREGDTPPTIGARVWVPFRNKRCLGIVIATHAHTTIAPKTLKTIEGLVDSQPILSASVLQLCHWVSQYYQSPLSEVIPLALPTHYRQGGHPKLPLVDYYALTCSVTEAHAQLNARSLKQQAIINFLAQHPAPVSWPELLQAGFQKPQLKPLLAKGLINQHSQELTLTTALTAGGEQPLQLNTEQALAVKQIIDNPNDSTRFLLQGVTGSGKTEVYLQVIAHTLTTQRQVLVLVPEIGLTPQLVARFRARFQVPLIVIHSNLSTQERQLAWHQAATDQAKIVIGTRTAIFTPMPKLGLIVIDEEHDASLKQLDGVRYSARDTALMRAHQEKIPIILGSATPSLESLYNCEQQKYQLLRINQQAMASSPLKWIISDLRCVKLQQGLASTTLTHIQRHLERDHQVLVFINRRGFAPILLCHQCGWMADCTACDCHLTLHRQKAQLICHHCGHQQRIPSSCPTCQSQELIPVGTGTQRLTEFLQTQFPTTSIMRIDRDEVRQKDELTKRLEQINQGEAQLIVGTQMMAKGHHFPKLTLVVVVDADAGFYNQDFRAIERLGQLLTQVAGRAGRAKEPGEVIIQTHFPDNPFLNTLIQQGYDAFATALLKTRAAAQLPPHAFLAIIRAQSTQAHNVLKFLLAIKKHLEQTNNPTTVQSYGPAPAPMAKKANQQRMQLLFKASSRQQLQRQLSQLREWIHANKLDSNIRWHVDVDPIDLS